MPENTEAFWIIVLSEECRFQEHFMQRDKPASNVCSDHIRKRIQARETESGRQQMEGQTGNTDYNLERALEQLPEKTRLPLVMHFLDGASVKTISGRLNLSHSGVYLRLRTGIGQLHELMVGKESEK